FRARERQGPRYAPAGHQASARLRFRHRHAVHQLPVELIVARRIESHIIAGPAGNLESLLEEPEDRDPAYAALVCHPHPLYGGTMHNKVVYRLARGLRRRGGVVLRFNFRGVGASHGAHGDLEGEIEDAREALAWLCGRYPGLPYALAGFSFG